MTSISSWREAFFPRGALRAGVLLDLVHRRWMIHWRWVIVAVAGMLLAAERFVMPDNTRSPAVLICVIVLALMNLVWTMMSAFLDRHEQATAQQRDQLLMRVVWLTNAQMSVDLILLTILLRYTGGVENPLVVFYLFHVILAAHLLRAANAVLQALLAIGLFTVIAVGEWSGWLAPHYDFLPATPDVARHQSGVIVLSSVLSLAVAIAGCMLSMVRVSRQVDEQERHLQHTLEALRRSHDEIERMQLQRARFMWTSAHQLKSPMAAIQTMAALIRDDRVPAGRVRGVAERIVKRCELGIEQVTELLTLARIEQAAPDRHRTANTPLTPMLINVQRRFHDVASAKGVWLHVDLDGARAAHVAVAADDLEDVLNNLVDNAIKYTPSGGHVSIRTHADADRIEVTVQDDGMGIAEESIGELFEPFRRGETALRAGIPGSGLGLAIVREVLTQAGGDVQVRSREGQGSTFTITLPAVGKSLHRAVQAAGEYGHTQVGRSSSWKPQH